MSLTRTAAAADARPQAALAPPLALFRALRPQQWVKNTLVFAALVFSGSLLDGAKVLLSAGAFAAFCLAGSGVYLLNDVVDLERDRLHPLKRRRPLAAGLIRPGTALAIAGVLAVAAMALAIALNPVFSYALAFYLALNVAYSLGLKHVVILDVLIVSWGFVLRAVAGALVIGVQASPWLVLCTLMLALLVSLGKRRRELTLLEGHAAEHRLVLNGYSTPFLDHLMGIAASAALVTYTLYTMSPDTVARVGTSATLFTTPFVIYGVLRYLYLVHQCDEGADPSSLFLRDLPTLINALLWIGVFCVLLYLRRPS